MQKIFLDRLALYNFKNYEEAELNFSSPVVCFLGNNGSGKTNLLDAIYYLSFTKSFFNPADTQNITSGHDQGSITGEFKRGDMPELVSCGIRKNHRKVMKRNFKEYEKLAEHIGLLPAVIVTPYDIELIWEGSEERRRFIDTTISQYSKTYLDQLLQYNHVLAQRNNLLKSFAMRGGFSADVLEPWDYQLADKAQFIHTQRELFLKEFIPTFTEIYEIISSGKEQPQLVYESELNTRNMMDMLAASQEKDRILERTTCGIHKDDLDFQLNGFSLKKYASQGQQKSFLFALKLAQYALLRNHTGTSPILMLDDLFDKVDEQRVHQILLWLKENNVGQVFITDTHTERIPAILQRMHMPHEVWHVDGGKAIKNSEEMVHK